VGAREDSETTVERPAILLIDSRDEVGAHVGEQAGAAGLRLLMAQSLEEVMVMARGGRPAGVVAHLGFDRRSGVVASLAARTIVPDAPILIYAEAADAALVPLAARVGLGGFLISSAPTRWPPRLMSTFLETAALLATLREDRSALHVRGVSFPRDPLPLAGLLVDVEVSLIRAALAEVGTVRGAARLLCVNERTLRGRIDKLAIVILPTDGADD
jgi:DNA-binding NtrC family response regulator